MQRGSLGVLRLRLWLWLLAVSASTDVLAADPSKGELSCLILVCLF